MAVAAATGERLIQSVFLNKLGQNRDKFEFSVAEQSTQKLNFEWTNHRPADVLHKEGVCGVVGAEKGPPESRPSTDCRQRGVGFASRCLAPATAAASAAAASLALFSSR
jgi:hypothetical protein